MSRLRGLSTGEPGAATDLSPAWCTRLALPLPAHVSGIDTGPQPASAQRSVGPALVGQLSASLHQLGPARPLMILCGADISGENASQGSVGKCCGCQATRFPELTFGINNVPCLPARPFVPPRAAGAFSTTVSESDLAPADAFNTHCRT